MIIKNELPILEYDDYSAEVIAPNHDWENLTLPKKCLFAFLGDVVEKYATEHNAEIVEEFITFSHNVKIYVLHEDPEDICLVRKLSQSVHVACLPICQKMHLLSQLELFARKEHRITICLLRDISL